MSTVICLQLSACEGFSDVLSSIKIARVELLNYRNLVLESYLTGETKTTLCKEQELI